MTWAQMTLLEEGAEHYLTLVQRSQQSRWWSQERQLRLRRPARTASVQHFAAE